MNINYNLIGFSEIDKYAITSYCAVHNVDKSNNLGDVSKIKSFVKYKNRVDLVVGGSPCQDFSIAGKQQGSMFECLDCGSEWNPLKIHYSKRDHCPKCNSINLDKTRSSLLIEYLRAIREIKPGYFIYENVKNIIGKRFKGAFDLFNAELQEYGYNTYYQVLNAKDYGVPQNRERIFVIGIRQDIGKGSFEFPEPFDSGLRLKDLLQDDVEKKYYINNDRVDKLLEKLKGELPNQDISYCIDANYAKGTNIEGFVSKKRRQLVQEDVKICAERGRYNENGKIEQQLEPRKDNSTNALTTVQKDNLLLEPVVCEQRADEGLRFFKDNVCGAIRTIDAGGDKRVIEKHPNELQLFTNLSGGKWDKIHESARRVYEENGIAPTIPTCGGGNIEPKVCTQYKIRKLTPRECWRLMGFSDKDFDKARQALIDTHYNGKDRANSQLYKQAGNSIVVNVLVHIYKKLFKHYLQMVA